MAKFSGASAATRFREMPLELRLDAREIDLVQRYVWRVLAETTATLVEAALFGSRARGDARPDSDIDLLLVFRELPWDREPTATIAERIADEMASRHDVPLGAWSVSLDDLRAGARTPMLVDALEDAIPVWCWPEPLPPVEFTPADALNCCAALVERLEEGSTEFAHHLQGGDPGAALRRGRDDIVRASTGLLLLDGITRPRRGDAAAALLELEREGHWLDEAAPVLRWCADTFGPDRKDDRRPFGPPPGGLERIAATIDTLAAELVRRCHTLDARIGEPFSGGQFTD